MMAGKLASEALGRITEEDPLFWYRAAGRSLMGVTTGLGGPAFVGNTLTRIQQGHDLLDALLNGGLGGKK
jgi:hypothetical protein